MSGKTRFVLAATMAIGSFTLVGCQTDPPKTAAEQGALENDSQAALRRMIDRDPSLRKFVDNAYAYAIFPSIGKGGVIIGGASGRGEVFEQGRFIGYASLGQITGGAQIGGQEFAELVAFQDAASFAKFRDGKEYSFTANANAVAIKAGAGAEGHFEEGVAAFVLPTGGLMAEASIGGQKFKFHPATEAERASYRTGNASRTTTETRTETHTEVNR